MVTSCIFYNQKSHNFLFLSWSSSKSMLLLLWVTVHVCQGPAQRKQWAYSDSFFHRLCLHLNRSQHASDRLDSLSCQTECVKVKCDFGICRSLPELAFWLLTVNLKRKIVNEEVNFASKYNVIAGLAQVFLTLSFGVIQEFSWTPVRLGAPCWTARPCAVWRLVPKANPFLCPAPCAMPSSAAAAEASG